MNDPVKDFKKTVMVVAAHYITQSGLTQREVAERCGTHQSRISNLMKQHVDKFSIESILEIVHKLGGYKMVASMELEEHNVLNFNIFPEEQA
ncbi:helix-turn-helix domain-containing protein [Pseudomonas phage vB_PaeS_B8]|uniref:HTH cro/C1-type domain-containing protein n=22 Tax=Viruses TaxID=10239 RepID=K4RI21_9CAUD|nr:HTH DNA binding protein [Pseudomonas phage JG004]YP_007236844.1 HTH DNA binding protein [Pseudomonas phage vB_PaeM_C2-10_Ab1]YP_008857190.1 HTH DNA binding protein [Pseudomonas phage PAK_P2]YP_008859360.1 HTH DNA binding protein [Pseudomonas phage PAK_P4]YP_009224719.1 HTH DNA binding protein [Pseudomonas phage PaoP5]YP_009287444.1 HTH DNA binding protein [Pseudomonas phage vB_PaeM_MAG1]YP_009598010.1 HTH DNA binding protein [Pseudomonas phage PA10]YP_009598076.1 HTH DNA binding protein [